MNEDFEEALRIAPDIVGELRAHVAPGRSGTQERSAPGRKPSAPLNLSAVDDADDLFALLREHASALAEQLGRKPPATVAWAPVGERGLPANTTPEVAFQATRALCRFLSAYIALLEDEDLAEAIINDVTSTVFRLDNKYPVDAPDEHVKARCAACETLAVYRRPPRFAGGDETYACRSCGRHHTEAEVRILLELRAVELKSRRRTA